MKTNRLEALLRKTAATCFFALTGALFSVPAGAGIPTIDATAIAKAAIEYAEQAARWAETVKHYTDQINHYRQMVASVMNLSLSGLTMSNDMKPITDPAGFVTQACPGSGSLASALLDITGFSALDITGNVAQSQQQLCQRITLLQVKKYNETVDLLNRMNDKYNSLFKQIESLRALFSNSGDIQASTNQVARSELEFNQDVENWRTRMNAYDAAIQTLQSQQSILANIALKGANSSGTVGGLIGNIVQAGAFAAAFHD